MTQQVHVVSTDALGTLGTVIDATAGRDAVHLAVEPAVAGEKLYPGSHVRLAGGRAVTGGETFGIVDPFLKGPVYEGQHFWLVVYPRTITSLRHVWEHPAFVPVATEATAPTVAENRKTASEKWMTDWAMEHMSDDYYGDRDKRTKEEAYAAAIRAGHDHFVGPYESARDYIDSEWWEHWEAITGEAGDRDEYFSCGC